MSILGFISTWVWALIFGLLLVGSIIATIFSANDTLNDKGYTSLVVSVVAILLFGGLCGFSATHTVIGPNTSAIVIDGTTGNLIGGQRGPGMTSVPLFYAQVLKFPAADNHEMCNKFTPSVEGGYGVEITLCFYLNARSVNWINQYARYSKGDFASLSAAWNNQLSPLVAEVVKRYKPQQLTSDREMVSSAILYAIRPWFFSEGIQINRVALSNWDFSNKDVAAAFDATIVAQTMQAQAQAKYDAAVVSRKQQLYEAETQGQVMLQLAKNQSDAMREVGISGEQSVVQWLTIQWLKNLDKAPDTIIVNTSQTPVAVTGK